MIEAAPIFVTYFNGPLHGKIEWRSEAPDRIDLYQLVLSDSCVAIYSTLACDGARWEGLSRHRAWIEHLLESFRDDPWFEEGLRRIQEIPINEFEARGICTCEECFSNPRRRFYYFRSACANAGIVMSIDRDGLRIRLQKDYR